MRGLRRERTVGTGAALAAGLALALGIVAGSAAPAGAAPPRLVSPPRVSGTAQEGQLLHAQPGAWRAPRPSRFAYQWQVCSPAGLACVDVAGATTADYAVRHADLGQRLRVRVTAIANAGSSSAATQLTDRVAAAPEGAPVATAQPSIAGKAQAGATLRADAGTWLGEQPVSFAYAWWRCDMDGGSCRDLRAHAQTYDLGGGDVGQTLRVLVRARNSRGTSTALSSATVEVSAPRATPSAPENTSLPTVSGTTRQGATLTGNRGEWSNSPTSFDFFWLRCGANGGSCATIIGATGGTYALTSADVGNTIRFRVTARNQGGSTTADSAPTQQIAPALSAPVNTSPPAVTGAPQQGQTLTGNRGQWSNNPTDFDFFWLRCAANGGSCAAISGAAGSTYRLTSADVGNTIRFRVTAKNAAGSNTAESAPTPQIAAAASAPRNTSLPTISGTPQQGQTLTGNRGEWASNPTDFDFFWLRCGRNGGNCAAIGGANGGTYALTSADVGNTVRFRVTAKNGAGNATATSAPTAVIQAPAPAPPPPPPPPPSGCPGGSGAIAIGDLRLPARLVVDQIQFSPSVVRRDTQELVARIHVSACTRPVQGALVYATAVPFNQVSIPAEAATGADGWAELRFQTLRGFPVSRVQQLLALFVRARKPGENVLAGVSTRRLVSVRVDLRG